MTATTPPAVTPPATARPVLRVRSPLVAAWAVPVMVAGQFAMLAIVPVTVLVVRTFRNPRLRALRPWAAGLAAVYATPLALWAVGPDRAPSLSKDMHPALMVLVVAAGVAMALRAHLELRRARERDGGS